MKILYVYNHDTKVVVAKIRGGNSTALEEYARNHFDLNDEYASTYSPAFGFADGLIDNSDAQQIDLFL